MSVEFLKSIRNMLVGSSRRKLNLSVKWDGAFIVFCGVNPEKQQILCWIKISIQRNS